MTQKFPQSLTFWFLCFFVFAMSLNQWGHLKIMGSKGQQCHFVFCIFSFLKRLVVDLSKYDFPMGDGGERGS